MKSSNVTSAEIVILFQQGVCAKIQKTARNKIFWNLTEVRLKSISVIVAKIPVNGLFYVS